MSTNLARTSLSGSGSTFLALDTERPTGFLFLLLCRIVLRIEEARRLHDTSDSICEVMR